MVNNLEIRPNGFFFLKKIHISLPRWVVMTRPSLVLLFAAWKKFASRHRARVSEKCLVLEAERRESRRYYASLRADASPKKKTFFLGPTKNVLLRDLTTNIPVRLQALLTRCVVLEFFCVEGPRRSAPQVSDDA